VYYRCYDDALYRSTTYLLKIFVALSYAGARLDVCPPVRLSHTDIDSKLITERVIAVGVPATALSIEE